MHPATVTTHHSSSNQKLGEESSVPLNKLMSNAQWGTSKDGKSNKVGQLIDAYTGHALVQEISHITSMSTSSGYTKNHANFE